MDIIEYNLLKALLDASDAENGSLLGSLIKSISLVLSSKTCSLWKINKNSNSTSVVAREIFKSSPGEDGDESEKDYVHPIGGSLMGKILDDLEQSGLSYIGIPNIQEKKYLDIHSSRQKVLDLRLKKLISISIPNHDNKEKYEVDSILNIYFSNEDAQFNESHAKIIKDHFALTMSRMRLITREQITSDIIKVYGEKGRRDLSSILFPIINQVLKKYIPYEACSVFVWDPAIHKFVLTQTTGIKCKLKKSEILYEMGEGVTGIIADRKECLLIPDVNDNAYLRKLGIRDNPHKWQEVTKHPPRSFMGIPISNPARREEIIGVIRFTNRLNQLDERIIDYFSDEDLELVKHACNLIALYMEYERSENARVAFAKQMSHEMLAPASSIRSIH